MLWWMDEYSKEIAIKMENEGYDSLTSFKNIFGIKHWGEQSLFYMMNWIRSCIEEIPNELGDILLFTT